MLDESFLAALYRRPENIGILTVVIAELKLGDVERQIPLAHLVVRPDDSALEDRPEALNRVRVDRTDDVLTERAVNHGVRVLVTEFPIGRPLVRNQQTDLFGNRSANEARKCLGVDAVDNLGDHLPTALDRTSNRNLAVSRAPTSAAASAGTALVDMSVLDLPTDKHLVHFHDAKQTAEVLVLQSDTDAVTHRPCGTVRTSADDTMDLQSGNALLASQHHVNDLEPSTKRIVGVLEDGADQYGEPIALRRALMALPMEWAAIERVDLFVITPGTANRFRPALVHQVGLAGVLTGEQLLKLTKGELMDNFFGSGHCFVSYREENDIGLECLCQVVHNRLNILVGG